jgi:hypothetical protein
MVGWMMLCCVFKQIGLVSEGRLRSGSAYVLNPWAGGELV